MVDKEFDSIHKSYIREDERAYDKYIELLKVVALEYIKDLAYLKDKYECIKYVDEKFVNTSIELIKKYEITEKEVDEKLNHQPVERITTGLGKQLERSRKLE